MPNTGVITVNAAAAVLNLRREKRAPDLFVFVLRLIFEIFLSRDLSILSSGSLNSRRPGNLSARFTSENAGY
jgi:hypothetical protein